MASRTQALESYITEVNEAAKKFKYPTINFVDFDDMKCFYSGLADSEAYKHVVNAHLNKTWPDIILNDEKDIYELAFWKPKNSDNLYKSEFICGHEENKCITGLNICIPSKYYETFKSDGFEFGILLGGSFIQNKISLEYCELTNKVTEENGIYKINLLEFLGNIILPRHYIKYYQFEVCITGIKSDDVELVCTLEVIAQIAKEISDSAVINDFGEREYDRAEQRIMKISTIQQKYKTKIIYDGKTDYKTIILIDNGKSEIDSIDFEIAFKIGKCITIDLLILKCSIPAESIKKIHNGKTYYELDYTTIEKCTVKAHEGKIHEPFALHAWYTDYISYELKFKELESEHNIKMYHVTGNILAFGGGSGWLRYG
jgi:hypothetical protein